MARRSAVPVEPHRHLDAVAEGGVHRAGQGRALEALAVGWILEPGRDLFVVLNETLSERDGRLSARNESVAFKIGYTLRF